ncbi:hypothetical protein BC826DRAFT_967507 [Russula brevipes]|nr:hypothetical protein BC826DRAFT_967507 [Russula brevipes]
MAGCNMQINRTASNGKDGGTAKAFDWVRWNSPQGPEVRLLRGDMAGCPAVKDEWPIVSASSGGTGSGEGDGRDRDGSHFGSSMDGATGVGVIAVRVVGGPGHEGSGKGTPEAFGTYSMPLRTMPGDGRGGDTGGMVGGANEGVATWAEATAGVRLRSVVLYGGMQHAGLRERHRWSASHSAPRVDAEVSRMAGPFAVRTGRPGGMSSDRGKSGRVNGRGHEAQFISAVNEFFLGLQPLQDRVGTEARRGRHEGSSDREVILLPDPIGSRISSFIRAGEFSREPGVETQARRAQFGATTPFGPIGFPDI